MKFPQPEAILTLINSKIPDDILKTQNMHMHLIFVAICGILLVYLTVYGCLCFFFQVFGDTTG